MSKKQIKTKIQDELIPDREKLTAIRRSLDIIEDNIRAIKKNIFSEDAQKITQQFESNDEAIDGVYNGEVMIDGSGKTHQVPANYASKSKLIPGDVLKLSIADNGTFIYKQIAPVERKKIVGEVGEELGKYFVQAEGKNYDILLASATYYKLAAGDKVTIIVPENKESTFAAVENKI